MMKRSGKERSQRQLRVGEQIKRLLVEYMQREFFTNEYLQDTGTITVTEVQISPDLRTATAFVIPLGGLHAKEVVEALNEKANAFSHYVARHLETKNSPKISFAVDNGFDEADRIAALLKQN